MDGDDLGKHQPLIKKRIILGRQSTERVKFEAPPPPPPKGTYPKKPAYWQIYGTAAYGQTNRNALALTFGACCLGALIMYKFDSRLGNMFKFFGIPEITPDQLEEQYIARRSAYYGGKFDIVQENTGLEHPARWYKEDFKKFGGVYSHGAEGERATAFQFWLTEAGDGDDE
ncbi:hypothetical protein HDE_14263 [Halotydeus destructor]|nr:hypothetical protein HDE_14263 [Halotydeus destructor]